MALSDALRDFRLNAYYRDPARNRSSFVDGAEGSALWFYERPGDARTFLIRSQAPYVIEQIQRAFGANPVDGRFGPNTLSAVRAQAAREGTTFPNQLTPDVMSYALRKAFHRGGGLVGMPIQFELPNVDHPVRAEGHRTFLGSIDVLTGQAVGMGANGQPLTPVSNNVVAPPAQAPATPAPPPPVAQPPAPMGLPPNSALLTNPNTPLQPPVPPPPPVPAQPARPSLLAPPVPTAPPAPSTLSTAPAPTAAPTPSVPNASNLASSLATSNIWDAAMASANTAFAHISGSPGALCPPCNTAGPSGQCKPMDPRDCDVAAETERRRRDDYIAPVLGGVAIVAGGIAAGLAVYAAKKRRG